MDRIREKLLVELKAKDDLIFRVGDTLDVKASILLIVITFLASQSVYFFDHTICGVPRYLQFLAVFCLVIGTVAIVIELWPLTYIMPYPESILADRIEELKIHFQKQNERVEPNVMPQLIEDEIKWTLGRIKANGKKNSKKSWWLNCAFYFVAAAILIDLVTLLWTMNFLL